MRPPSSQQHGSAGAEAHLQAGLHGRQHIALGHDAVRAAGLDGVRGHAGHAQVERGRRADAVVDLVVLVAAACLCGAAGLCRCSACGSTAACAAQASMAELRFCLAAVYLPVAGLFWQLVDLAINHTAECSGTGTGRQRAEHVAGTD